MRARLPLLGFGLPVSGEWATPDTMLHVAGRAEDLGYHSLWTFQRMLSPIVDVANDVPGNPADRAPDDLSYLAVHDAIVPLAYVAARTSRIRLGTATVCAPFTPPALLAKQFATLDHLSGGRLDVGLGMGWLRQEYVAAGVPFEARGARMTEYLRCLTALWTQDPVRFDGQFYRVPPSHPGISPVQRPHPPVLVGGTADAALRRAGALAQGWLVSSGQDRSRLADSVDLVRRAAHDAGRDPDAVRVVLRRVVEPLKALQDNGSQLRDELARLRRDGVTEVFLDLNFATRPSPDDAERVLSAFAPA